MKWLLRVCLLVIPGFIGAQTVTVSGMIAEENGQPIPFANIVASKDSSATMLAYAVSEVDGKFSILLPLLDNPLTFNLTAIGYAETSFSIRIGTDTSMQIVLEKSSVNLEEVVIKAKKKVVDTLVVGIHDMNLSENDNLGKILEKTSGVILGEDGSIMYQGKKIDKINVNGKEVFINQNKIALDNLTYEVMDGVQIIDNYKSKFALDFDRIKTPVINVTTKSAFRGIFKGEGEAGLGHRERFMVGGKGFHFSDRLNLFVTSNNNNYGERDLTKSSVLGDLEDRVSTLHESQISPLLNTEDQAKRNIVSNNSVTLRLETERSRTSGVFYYGNLAIDVNRVQDVFLGDTLLRQSVQADNYVGRYLSGNVERVQKIGLNTVFKNKTNFISAVRSTDAQYLFSVLYPNPVEGLEETKRRPESFSVLNGTEIVHLLGPNTIFRLQADIFHEKSTESMLSASNNSRNSPLEQRLSYRNTTLSLAPNFEFKLKNATVDAGLGVERSTEEGQVRFVENSYGDDGVSRNYTVMGLPLAYRGNLGKFEYSLSARPTLINTRQNSDKFFLRASNSIAYNFEAQNVLSLSHSRSYDFQDLNRQFETFASSINNITYSQVDPNDYLATKDNLSLSWFNNNLAKSKMQYFVYSYSIENNFLQSVLDSVNDNLFVYSVRQFDIKKSHNLNTGMLKSFYFGRNLSKIKLGVAMKVGLSQFPVIIKDEKSSSTLTTLEPSFTSTYIPRKFFIREIKNRLSWNLQTFDLDDLNINRQSLLNNTLTLEGGRDKVDWKLGFEYLVYEVDGRTFNVPDLNGIYSYKLSDKTAVSLTGQNLLSLFKLNNFNSVRTFSDGNLITRVYNDSILGYLVLSCTFKL